jgi:hypothetical protein
LAIFIPPISPQSPSPIIRGWKNRPVVAAVPKVPQRTLKKNSETSLNAFQNMRTTYRVDVNLRRNIISHGGKKKYNPRTSVNENQLIKDIFNQPIEERRLKRIWPEDLLDEA